MLLLETKRKNKTLDTIHFVGIGGIGMSGIAEIMFNLGYKIQGSDIAENANTKRLQTMGIKVFIGHDELNINDVSYVVLSSAISDDNPEVKAAIKQKIPVILRSQMLAELMRLKCSVAISGSHGKTTTTSLTACLFEAAGMDPTVINGGVINNRNTNAYLGQSEFLIAEADESDATFIKIPSTIGVITNIDREHMDYYKDFDTLIAAFRSFFTNLPFYGFGVACIDHPIVRQLVEGITERKIITYGIDSKDANLIAYNIKSDTYASLFDLKIQMPGVDGSTIIEQIRIPIPGRHNVLNCLAAIAIGIELDFGLKIIKDGFKKFAGVKRRFTKIAEYKNAEIIDDYAHHPAEIEATLSTAKSITKARGSKIITIFQPHRYSRLRDLFEDFSCSFDDADQLYVIDVFAAGEKSIPGFGGKELADNITKNGHKSVKYIADISILLNIIKREANPGDLILFMGAGSVSSMAKQISQEL